MGTAPIISQCKNKENSAWIIFTLNKEQRETMQTLSRQYSLCFSLYKQWETKRNKERQYSLDFSLLQQQGTMQILSFKQGEKILFVPSCFAGHAGNYFILKDTYRGRAL